MQCVLVNFFTHKLQEEMYIFMEYCDEGTLEEVSRLGLQEHVIRLYTKQITTAINVLHEHGIVHRDIKGNLFYIMVSFCFFNIVQCTPSPGRLHSLEP